MIDPKPEFLNLNKSADRQKFDRLVSSQHVHVVDDFKEQLKELFIVTHARLLFTNKLPSEFQKHLASKMAAKPLKEQGVWVYFPWRSTVSHILPEK